MLQIGSIAFGAVIGWYAYYVNRYRKEDVQLGDLATIIGIIGGAAVLALFPAGSELFGAYGLGLALGFFGYFLVLVMLVAASRNFDIDYFLDGRRRDPKETPGMMIPGEWRSARGSMGESDTIRPAMGNTQLPPDGIR